MFCFNNIYGNQNLIRNLKKINSENRINHSYIFNGDLGTGKKTIAFAFAKAIMCQNNKDGDCCNECLSCKTFESKNNPDVIFIDQENNSIGVDLIRESLIKNNEIKPFNNKYKVFIIENADKMTIQAQNSILKTIEQPFNYSIFILIVKNITNLLPTILSRCVTFRTKPLDKNKIKQILIKKENIEKETSEICSIYSQGSLGKALEMAKSQNFKKMRENVIDGLQVLLKKDIINLYKFISILESQKENIQDILDIFFLVYRDIIIFKNTKSCEYIIQKDLIDFIFENSKKYTNTKIIQKMESIVDAKLKLNQNVNYTMVLEHLFIKLKEK